MRIKGRNTDIQIGLLDTIGFILVFELIGSHVYSLFRSLFHKDSSDSEK